MTNFEYSRTDRTAGTLRLCRRELDVSLLGPGTQARTGNDQVMALYEGRRNESDSFCMSG